MSTFFITPTLFIYKNSVEIVLTTVPTVLTIRRDIIARKKTEHFRKSDINHLCFLHAVFHYSLLKPSSTVYVETVVFLRYFCKFRHKLVVVVL